MKNKRLFFIIALFSIQIVSCYAMSDNFDNYDPAELNKKYSLHAAIALSKAQSRPHELGPALFSEMQHLRREEFTDAVYHDKLQATVKAFVEAKVDINARDTTSGCRLLYNVIHNRNGMFVGLSAVGPQRRVLELTNIVEYLLRNGADPHLENLASESPLAVAIRWGRLTLITPLLKAGANPEPILAPFKDNPLTEKEIRLLQNYDYLESTLRKQYQKSKRCPDMCSVSERLFSIAALRIYHEFKLWEVKFEIPRKAKMSLMTFKTLNDHIPPQGICALIVQYIYPTFKPPQNKTPQRKENNGSEKN